MEQWSPRYGTWNIVDIGIYERGLVMVVRNV